MTTQRTRSLGRPTLDAVAARAGVGRGTVSRVVNGSPQVSPEARAAVQQAIAELGYVPNRAARALVTQRTDSVALVVSESGERVFTEPFFAGDRAGHQLRAAGDADAALAGHGAVAGRAGAGRAPPDQPARRRRTAAVVARLRPAADAAGGARPARRARRSARPDAATRRPTGLVRRRGQRWRGPAGGGVPGRAGAPTHRHHRRSAGHGRRPGPPGRLHARRSRPPGPVSTPT